MFIWVDCFYDLLIDLIWKLLDEIFLWKNFDLVSFSLNEKDGPSYAIPIFLEWLAPIFFFMQYLAWLFVLQLS